MANFRPVGVAKISALQGNISQKSPTHFELEKLFYAHNIHCQKFDF